MKRSDDLSIFHNSSSLGVSNREEMKRDKLTKLAQPVGRAPHHDRPGITISPQDDIDTESETDDIELNTIQRSHKTPYRDLFPKSPRAYLHSFDVCFVERTPVRIGAMPNNDGPFDAEVQRQLGLARRTEFTITQKGVRFRVDRLFRATWYSVFYLLGLNCGRSHRGKKRYSTHMVLKKVGANVFVRVRHCVERSISTAFSRDLIPGINSQDHNMEILVLSTIEPTLAPALDAVDHHAIRFELQNKLGRQVSLLDRIRNLRPTPHSLWESHNTHFLTLGQWFQGYVTFNAALLVPELHGQWYWEGNSTQTDEVRSPWIHLICGLGYFVNDGEVPGGIYPWLTMLTFSGGVGSTSELDDWEGQPWGQLRETHLKNRKSVFSPSEELFNRLTGQPVKDFQQCTVRIGSSLINARVTSEVAIEHARERPEHVVRVWAEQDPNHTKGKLLDRTQVGRVQVKRNRT
jgi:hypothetical protein